MTMTDVNERLERLERDRDAQLRAWIAKAAEHAGFHQPADALKLVDSARIATSADADRAVAGLPEKHPYLGRERISEAEQRRRWGKNFSTRSTGRERGQVACRRLRPTRRATGLATRPSLQPLQAPHLVPMGAIA
jgi:hypothetical protein